MPLSDVRWALFFVPLFGIAACGRHSKAGSSFPPPGSTLTPDSSLPPSADSSDLLNLTRSPLAVSWSLNDGVTTEMRANTAGKAKVRAEFTFLSEASDKLRLTSFSMDGVECQGMVPTPSFTWRESSSSAPALALAQGSTVFTDEGRSYVLTVDLENADHCLGLGLSFVVDGTVVKPHVQPKGTSIDHSPSSDNLETLIGKYVTFSDNFEVRADQLRVRGSSVYALKFINGVAISWDEATPLLDSAYCDIYIGGLTPNPIGDSLIFKAGTRLKIKSERSIDSSDAVFSFEDGTQANMTCGRIWDTNGVRVDDIKQALGVHALF